MSEDIVLLEPRGAEFRITLNRPQRRNALNNPLLALVSEGFRQAVALPETRVIVLTGAGERSFCAGGDLAPNGGFDFDFAQPRTAYGDLLQLALGCPLPIVAAVNGHCVAGGMGLLALADMAVTVNDARFGLPEVKVGLFPMQVAALLRWLVPDRMLREWALTGDLFDADIAREVGLVNRVVPREGLEPAIADYVARLSAPSPTAIRRGKYALRAMEGMQPDQAIAFAEGQLGLLTLTEDAREGLASFQDKRTPRFTGR